MTPKNDRERIYLEYYDKVFGYVFSRIHRRPDTEDVVSIIFLKIYERIEGYDAKKASLSTWIYAITRNAVADYFRSTKHAAVPLNEDPGYIEPAEEENLDELLEQLHTELQRLPEIQRDILILHYYFDMGHKEIAGRLGLSYDNTRKQCSLGIGTLRSRLKR